MPIEQYRKDGRIIRGLQRGAASFGTSTASAALELSNRLVQAIQVCTGICMHIRVCLDITCTQIIIHSCALIYYMHMHIQVHINTQTPRNILDIFSKELISSDKAVILRYI